LEKNYLQHCCSCLQVPVFLLELVIFLHQRLLFPQKLAQLGMHFLVVVHFVGRLQHPDFRPERSHHILPLSDALQPVFEHGDPFFASLVHVFHDAIRRFIFLVHFLFVVDIRVLLDLCHPYHFARVMA
jgi:hypothetical protein